jgi:hypothetical protein
MVQMVVDSGIRWRTRWNDEEKVTFEIELEHKPTASARGPTALYRTSWRCSFY